MLSTENNPENKHQFEYYLNPNSNDYSNPLQPIPRTIAFIDRNIFDADKVQQEVQADLKIFLDPSQDGIAQITETLKHYKDLTGVDIISHGNVGELQLGNSSVQTDSINQYAGQLQHWGESLDPKADILLYGCNVASGETGKAFVNNLSQLIGADVAASTDFTGNVFKGGNWNLEYTTGIIETATPFRSSFTTNYKGLLDSVFDPTATPTQLNVTDGSGSAGDYELGMEFKSASAGQISAIRYYKAASETGTHTGRIWSSTGQQLASVNFTNETASGWQQQALSTPLTIQPNTTYVVSVNTNSYYAMTPNGIASTITNGSLSAVADGSNGVYYTLPGRFPNKSYQNSNYFRDIVFTPSTPPANNTLGSITLSGTPTEDQTLSATVADADGLNGVTINYQWQQSSDGTNWSDISGATAQTLTLGDAQVNKQVRAKATYTDAGGSSENISSTATAAVSNINDRGIATITGTPALNNIVTANITDADGLAGVTIGYQWQRLQNDTWTNIDAATNQTLTLDNSLVGQQIRVNAIYTDVLGGSENIVSAASNPISATSAISLFPSTLTPSQINLTDGTGSKGDYELGMEFRSSTVGQISEIRYYKAPSETGTHTGKIWSSSGQLLASVTFTNETASGWQQQALSTPLIIQPNTTYVVSVNANSYYAVTSNGIASTITNGALSAVADGSNGVYNITPGNFPSQSYQNENYFRDIVFTPSTPPANNNSGIVTLSELTATQNQTLSATVADTDGLTGVTINYQWQQSSDNGTTWTNITGATNQTFILGQAQVNNQVRATATYTDALGSSENVTSTATAAVGNINDPGTVAIIGTTALGNIVTANVTDADGLNGVSIGYQWQQLQNNTWSDIAGATNQTLTLDNSLVGQQIRVNALYTDALGGSENIVSAGSTAIAASSPSSLFASTATPSQPNMTDGSGSRGDYELGMEFKSNTAGQISAIKYYKSPSETGTHIGRIWSSTGEQLGSVTFTNETASGWQQQVLATPVTIQPNTTYVVSVNANSYYAVTPNGIATTISNGALSAVADGSNGVYNTTPGNFPSQSYQNENYFRDVVFTTSTTTNGTITLSGTAAEYQSLSATVADADGLTGVTISYQWQQSSDNGITWTDITKATGQTLTLSNAQIGKQVRVRASYIDALGNGENVFSTATASVLNVNDPGVTIVRGSATPGHTLTATVFDDDGLTGVNISYQWQQSSDNGTTWTNIADATATTPTLALGTSLLGEQVRVNANYNDALGDSENIFSFGANVANQNPIVLENQKSGTTAWKITNLAANNEIAGYAAATSVNKGESLPLKVSLAQPGQYEIDVYRLGYYGGTGGRLVTSSGLLNGVTQSGPTIDPNTRLVEYNWATSYNLLTGNNWTSGLYIAKLRDATTGKQSYVPFAVRDDNRPAEIGFQDAVTTAQAYNNQGGYSIYDANSTNGQRAFAVSFDRPYAPTYFGMDNKDGYSINNMMAWEYNMVRWMESQGYDISYYTNLDVATNPRQLYSQNAFLSVGHDEYWSMEMFNNIEKARDNGINLAFFSANTAYWRVRLEPSSTGQANRVMVAYKGNWNLDPVAQNDTSQATNVFRSSQVNRPENSLLGVMYVANLNASKYLYSGFDWVVNNSSDPYYAHTGLQNGDILPGLVGYEWDGIVNNGFTPAGLVKLSQSTAQPSGGLPILPSDTDASISNAVRYTAPSGAKVFSTGTIQWAWGLDTDGVTGRNIPADPRIQQITVNVLADMGAKPQTPDNGIIVV